jgi:hypothetical protein
MEKTMSKIFDVIAATGTYTDREGNEKTRWTKCGIKIQKDDGSESLKMDVVPLGGDGWFTIKEQKPRSEEPRQDYQPKPQPVQEAAEFDDEIPF